VVGFFAANSATLGLTEAFRQGLSETGWVVGQNLAIEYRWAEGHYDRLPSFAADFVGRKVDLILATGGNHAALAAKTRPRRSRSFSSPATIRWRTAWSRACLAPAVT
jgi:putative ABC transport system substrate-binding protein